MNITKELVYAETLSCLSALSVPDVPWHPGCGTHREAHLNRRMQKRLDAYRRAKRIMDVAFDFGVISAEEHMLTSGALRTSHIFWLKNLSEIEQEKARLLGGL